jgi:uncharacterized membrane protein YeaQ/YmgE (transglycosylase-associated protein family)
MLKSSAMIPLVLIGFLVGFVSSSVVTGNPIDGAFGGVMWALIAAAVVALFRKKPAGQFKK